MSAISTDRTVTAGLPQSYELKITRTFDAPRELVWRAWTEPGMLMQWRGPRGFQVKEIALPMKEGAPWHAVMEGRVPATQEPVTLLQSGVVKEVRPPELLVYTFAWEDRSKVGLPESPFEENTVTVRLEEQEGKTIMHFTQGPFVTESERDGHTGGWNSAFDRFAEFMLAEQPGRVPAADEVPSELHLRRFFAAPRQMVFDAWTKPEMVKEWWGPKGFSNRVEAWEARGGGRIRVDMIAPDGKAYPMGGRFVEFYPPYRFHFVTTALDGDGNAIFENWNSVFFEEADGGTMVTLDVHVMSQTAAAPQYLKGMRQGWTMSLDKLAEFVSRQ